MERMDHNQGYANNSENARQAGEKGSDHSRQNECGAAVRFILRSAAERVALCQ